MEVKAGLAAGHSFAAGVSVHGLSWTRSGEDNRLLQLSALYSPAFSIGGGGPGDPAAGIGPGWASELA